MRGERQGCVAVIDGEKKKGRPVRLIGGFWDMVISLEGGICGV